MVESNLFDFVISFTLFSLFSLFWHYILTYSQRSARRGGGSSFSRPSAPPARRPVSTHAPATKPAPVPVPQSAAMQTSSGGGGMLSGIGSTIAQGMAFGTGSAIAHRAVGAVAESFTGSGSSNEQPSAQASEYTQGGGGIVMQQQQMTDVCAMDKTMFYDCLQQNKGDQAACDFLYEQLKQCQQNQMQFQ